MLTFSQVYSYLTTLYLSKFIFCYTQLRLLSSIHLISLPSYTSEPLITPFYQSKIPFCIPECKYLKTYINPQDMEEAHPSLPLSCILCEMITPIFILWFKISYFVTCLCFHFI